MSVGDIKRKKTEAGDGVDNDHAVRVIILAFKRLQEKTGADWLIDFVCNPAPLYYSQNRDGAQSQAHRPDRPSSSGGKKTSITHQTIRLLDDGKVESQMLFR